MRTPRFFRVAGILFLCSIALPGCLSRQKALWIEVKEKGDHRATIAMTEPIARQLLDSDEPSVDLTNRGRKDIITREMLRSVLDGREESVEAQDENGSEVKL